MKLPTLLFINNSYFLYYNFYIKHKNFFFIFNILSATFLSPPDVNSQLSLFIIFSIILEIFQFINLYRIKIINMATY